MKKEYVSPEFDFVVFRMESTMSDYISSPGDGGHGGDGGEGGFGDGDE